MIDGTNIAAPVDAPARVCSRWLRPVRRATEQHRSMKWSLLFALVLLGCKQATTQQPTSRGYVTDLDFTTATEYKAEALRPLREFGTNNVEGFSDNYIFGAYRNPMDMTGGHNFHVFPDGCFVIEEFCDIGEPVTVALGRWKLEENALVVSGLTEKTNSSAILGMKWVRKHFGAVERLRVFVTGRDEAIADTILVSDNTVREGKDLGWKYVRRIEYYRDWRKEEQKLLGK